MDKAGWFEQRRDAAIDALVADRAPSSAGIALAWMASSSAQLAWLLAAIAVAATGIGCQQAFRRGQTELLSRLLFGLGR
jgi:hypothetical protein